MFILYAGTRDDCEDQKFMSKSEGRALADRGDLVSSSTEVS
jgi:hypothetical protein